MQIEALKEGDTTRERKKTLSRNLRRRPHFAAGLPCPVRKGVVDLDLLPPLHQRRRGGVEVVQGQSPVPNRGTSHHEAGEKSGWGKDRETSRSCSRISTLPIGSTDWSPITRAGPCSLQLSLGASRQTPQTHSPRCVGGWG